MGLTKINWMTSLCFLIVLIQYANALRCYHCTSNWSTACGDPMNNTEHHGTFHIKECTEPLPQNHYSYGRYICRKIVRRVHGQREIIRECSKPTPEERDIVDGRCSQMAESSYITIESCNICSTDFCNSATSISGKTLFFATFGAIFTICLSVSKISIFQ